MIAPVQRAQAEQLVLLYNRVTAACPNVPRDVRGVPVGRKVTESSVREATVFLRFCAEHAIDPERFIVARHEAVQWRTRIALKELHRIGDNFLSHFKTWGDASAHESTRDVQPIEDFEQITPLTERLKATRADDPELCMLLPDTRGWHPASTWCQECRQADPCRRRLNAATRARREAHAG